MKEKKNLATLKVSHELVNKLKMLEGETGLRKYEDVLELLIKQYNSRRKG